MKPKIFRIPNYIYFIIATLIVIFLVPREGKFRYAFYEGRPWQYGLLTAPFDFPVYKTDKDVKQEQDSIVKNFVPYFKHNPAVVNESLSAFRMKAQENNLNPVYRQYVEKQLTEIYKGGVVPVSDLQLLEEDAYETIMVFDEDNVARPRAKKNLHSNRTAYTEIINNLPSYLDKEVLRSLELNNYLHDNLKYDDVMSDKVKQELISKISLSSGLVQAGEKIIDRGEIVDNKTFNILRSLQIISEKQGGTVQRQLGYLAGTGLIIVGLMICFYLYFYYLRKNIFHNNKDIFFILSILTLFVILTELATAYKLFNVYIIPYAIVPLVIRTFFDSRTAQMTHSIVVMICSLMVPLAFEFLFIQLIVCMVAIYALKDLTQRSQLIRCAFYILLAYVLVYILFLFFQDGDLTNINGMIFLYFAINFLLVMFTYPFIYILEKIFGYISNVTLVELSDINTPLMQLFSEKCPGSFQHSLQVSTLGTAAANKVGANPQLVRTGALYHDIGKMENPGFFVENKISGNDPHATLTYKDSARIITGHVSQGVRLAHQYNIPQAIINFIESHHGTGKAKYFYNMEKNAHPDEPIDEGAFSYHGFNPNTKETAILMMSDAVEAASRSLQDYSKESISALVNKIIDGQIADGLLSEAPLTFKNISDIKAVFIDKLASLYHARIAYPDLEKN